MPSLLTDFKKWSKDRGYARHQEALSAIAEYRVARPHEFSLKKKMASPSKAYLKWLAHLPCAGCGNVSEKRIQWFTPTGDIGYQKNSYYCLPLCSTCRELPEIRVAIKIRFPELIFSVISTYLRCVEGE